MSLECRHATMSPALMMGSPSAEATAETASNDGSVSSTSPQAVIRNRHSTPTSHSSSLIPMLLLLAVVLFVAPSLADISVRVERHFPCSSSSGPPAANLRLKFPSYKATGVNFKEDTSESTKKGHKCFKMSGGKVEVYAPGLDGTKKYYVHLETRIGIHGKPERCVNPDKEGCGGIGSCVHCDVCHEMGGSLRNFVQILKKDEPAKCSTEGLPAGEYDDLALRVCLPSKNELLPFLDPNANRAEQIWSIFLNSRTRGGSGEIPLVIAARIFDRPINKLNIKELNDALHGSKAGMIGCHWIYATVSQQGEAEQTPSNRTS